MKKVIKQLFEFDRQLLGAGYDNALEYINHLIGLDVLEYASGTPFGSWNVPDEWVIKDAWIKYKGRKILDYKKEPLSVTVYSEPFSGKVKKEELLEHIYSDSGNADSVPYSFAFYDRDWGFSMPHNKREALKDGEYEVFIDAEFKPGTMKIGVHTIPGKKKRETLIFAHLDHPYQANDNLSGVACLIDLAKRAESDNTIKLIFCPETIGSIAYVHTQDLSNVDYVISVDICGNDNSILFQQSLDTEHRINRVVHAALQMSGKEYRKGKFRNVIGSDEYPFNDPKIGIPGILFSRHPYAEYHTNKDTPDVIKPKNVKGVTDLINKTMEIWDKDYVPVRNFKGPLMRSRYDMQTSNPQVNLNYDYFFYAMDGEKSLAELCAMFQLPFDIIYESLEKVIKDGQIQRADTC